MVEIFKTRYRPTVTFQVSYQRSESVHALNTHIKVERIQDVKSLSGQILEPGFLQAKPDGPHDH